MEILQHTNSKSITIHRKAPFHHQANKEMVDWFKDAKRSIGSYFEKGSSRTATGLSPAEIDILLPYVIDEESTDRDFRKAVTKYFDAISTNIPHEGKKLEIGLKVDNNKPIIFKNEGGKEVYNLPIDIEHYIRYRHITNHPLVAKNKEDGKSNKLYEYYIEDVEVQDLSSEKFLKDRDEALALYLGISKDEAMVDRILATLGINYRELKGFQKISKLKSLAENKTTISRFMEAVKNPNLKYEKFVYDLVTNKIVRKEGNRYLFENEQVGATKEDFILYLKDEANSETKLTLKARLDERQ